MDKDKTQSQELQTPDMHRRKLLRGLSSVPVVATLTPVSASAVSLACTEKAPPQLPTPNQTVTQDGVSADYVCLQGNNEGVPDGFNALVNDPFNDGAVDTQVYTDGSGTAALGNYQQAGGNTRQCVIYVDQSGYTFNSAGGANNPISASCMLSLATP